MKIGARALGKGLPPLLLFDLSEGHEGDVQLGYRLIEEAGAKGAHGVALARGSLSEQDFKCVLGYAGHVGLFAFGVVESEEDLPLLVSMDPSALRLSERAPSALLEKAGKTRLPILLELSSDVESARRAVASSGPERAEGVALLARDPRMMGAWREAWPSLPVGVRAGGLTPDELRALGAALVETEHRLSVPSVLGRNRP